MSRKRSAARIESSTAPAKRLRGKTASSPKRKKTRSNCRDCAKGDKKDANYPDEEGKSVLCAEHARAAGSYQVQ